MFTLQTIDAHFPIALIATYVWMLTRHLFFRKHCSAVLWFILLFVLAAFVGAKGLL